MKGRVTKRNSLFVLSHEPLLSDSVDKVKKKLHLSERITLDVKHDAAQ